MKKFTCVIFVAFLVALFAVTSMAAQTEGIINNGIYTIENQASGLFISVHNGNDANATNVYQNWFTSANVGQSFRVEYIASEDAYKIWVMSSKGGVGIVLPQGYQEEVKTQSLTTTTENNMVTSGCNVCTYAGNSVGTYWLITKNADGTYSISPKNNPTLAMTKCGAAAGTSGGTTINSVGNIFVATKTDLSEFNWIFTLSDWSYMFSSTTQYTYVSAPFAQYRGQGDFHKGTDFAQCTSAPLYLVDSGTVIRSEEDNHSAGNFTVVKLSDGFTVRYLHMDDFVLYPAGTVLSKGAYMGTVGNTGDSSGPHLHFDVNTTGQHSGTYINCWENAADAEYFFPQINFTGVPNNP